MNVVSERRRTHPSPPSALPRSLVAITGGVMLFFVFALMGVALYDLAHARRIYSGVSVAGIDLSGFTLEEARQALSLKLTYPQTGKLVFQDGERVWMATPAELGLALEVYTTAFAAYDMGRSGGVFKRLEDQFSAWHAGANLSPIMVLDESVAQRYLSQIAEQVNQPTVEASLNIQGLDVVVIPGKAGRTVNIQATQMALEQQLRSLTDGLIPLVIEETSPVILDAEKQAEIARRILSAPLTLSIPNAVQGDPGPWVIPQQQLANMLTIERVQASDGWRYEVKISEAALTNYLTALVADIDRPPSNTRFIFNDDTRLLEVIQPAVIGRSLDIEASIQDIQQKTAQGEHNIPIKLQYMQPEVTDEASGAELGITELVIAYTSYFRGSTKERLQNIQTAAANFHGMLIPPGAIFSMANAMGSVSLDTGYAEAWIIYGGRTIKGVGGGVCQVSTTLFRTAFFAGYPIIERHPHAYRVGYYEQTRTGYDENLAGLDATVFLPLVDFKFMNDTPYWLLMETYFYPNSRSLTWKFYSTKDGRTVEWETTGPKNKVDPPDPVYEENPELAKGEIEQVDWAAEGADVTVTRTVYRDGVVLYYDTFITHYMPWADVYQYGPGTKLPDTNIITKKKRR